MFVPGSLRCFSVPVLTQYARVTYNGGRVFCFSEKRCYMLFLTGGSGGGNDSHSLVLLLPTARRPLLPARSPLCFQSRRSCWPELAVM